MMVMMVNADDNEDEHNNDDEKISVMGNFKRTLDIRIGLSFYKKIVNKNI